MIHALGRRSPSPPENNQWAQLSTLVIAHVTTLPGMHLAHWPGKNSQASRAPNVLHLLCGHRWGTFGTMSTTVACVFMEERRACTPQQNAPTSARRNLFGPVDHEQTRRLLHREMARISRQDTKRWNFNFKSEKPLTGRYEWTPVPVNAAASDTRDTTTSQTTPPAPANSPNSASSTASKTQTTITDYMRQRKRLSTSKVPENVISTKKNKAS